VTAVLWAVIHVQYDAYEMSIIVCMGLLLGAARLKTQCLFVPLAMHATMNIIAIVETVLAA
jgi:membrane protease YdiL (CAAX protease family)